ncbi:MAG TPA: cell division protein ZapA [Xanthobacteraceae bacterium]|jgi:cell division protein ZapA|nr:cell division protein ZapA [Xanthobacteraceae bacterium]
MAHVNVTINGRQYRMACEDGQEQHLTRLARNLDERIQELRGKFGQIGDARLIVMAALTIADDLAEMHKRVRQLQDEIAALNDARVVAADRSQATNAAIVAAFNAAAERIENIARRLNQTIVENNVAVG